MQQCSIRYFFNTKYQVKAIAIGISKANPLAKLVINLSLFTLHLFLPNLVEFYLKELPPYTHCCYIALYSRFSAKIGITFTRQTLDRNRISISISSIGIKTNILLTKDLHIVLFDLFPSQKHHLNFHRFPKENTILQTVIKYYHSPTAYR